jgi:acyl dehydratase
MAAGMYFEDFVVGQRVVSRGATLTESAILDFALLYDPQRFHLDVEAARESPYGGLIASGFQTLALGFRMFLQTGVLDACSIGSPGFDELRWIAPVRPGDTIHSEVEVLELRESRSKPDRGILIARMEMFNQRAEMVLSLTATIFILRRPAAGAE